MTEHEILKSPIVLLRKQIMLFIFPKNADQESYIEHYRDVRLQNYNNLPPASFVDHL